MMLAIMKYSEKVSEQLNELLTKTHDAEKTYTLAAEKATVASVKKFLRDKVLQRSAFAHELKDEIVKYGELPEKEGSMTGAIHRGWINLKAALNSNETEMILREIEKGEKASLESYNTILDNREIVLPKSTRELLEKQRNAIRAAINTSKMYEELVS